MHWALRNRASFAGHDRATQWDQLQRLYFSSYAMWNSLTTPFLFAQPGRGIDDCFEACSLMGRLLSQEWEGVYWVATRNVRTRRQERVGDEPSNGPQRHADWLRFTPSSRPICTIGFPLWITISTVERSNSSFETICFLFASPVSVKSGRFSSCNALRHRCFDFLLQKLVGNASSASTHRQCQSDLQPA